MPSGAIMQVDSDQASPAKRKFRADIQGLRAFAVLAVILDHLMQWPSGGFVGVDIFFVISGFLITGHLMREWELTGGVSFVGFYKSRIKRILPAASLTLVVTVCAAFFLLNKPRALSVFWDSIWAALFSANWRFASAGTDYFQVGGPVSPLQHFWSLAVEEQFYFVWPFVMLLALFFAAKFGSERTRPRVVAALVIGAISVLSLGWALIQTSSSPTTAYFSTFTRTWELGLGAILAIATPLLMKIPNRSRPIMAWLGLAGMVASLFVISADSAFPAPAAILPVIATGLVIAAGVAGDQRYLTPLTNKFSGYIGNISYSLYLWHFPIIILIGPLLPWQGPAGNILQLALIAIVSVVMFHMWEDAIRRGPWLDGRRAWKDHTPPSWRNVANLGVLAAVTFVAVGVAMLPNATSSNAGTSFTPITTVTAKAGDAQVEQSRIQAAVTTALAVTAWPTLTPSLDELGKGALATEWTRDGCLQEAGEDATKALQDASSCVYGDPTAQKTAVVMGSSLSISYMPGIRKALDPAGYKIIVYTMEQCPAMDLTVKLSSGAEHKNCNPFREGTFSAIAAIKPDVVILTGAKGGYDLEAWTKGTTSTLTRLSADTKKIVVLPDMPGNKALDTCATRFNSPTDCIGEPTSSYPGFMTATTKAAAAFPKATVVDGRTWYCSPSGKCPSFINNIPVLADGTHITAALSEFLAPEILTVATKTD